MTKRTEQRLKVKFISSGESRFPAIITVGQTDKGKCGALGPAGKALDKRLGGAIARGLTEAEFDASHGIAKIIRGSIGTVVVLGVGNDLAPKVKAEDLGGKVFAAMEQASLAEADFVADGLDAETLASIAYGAVLASYRFGRYFTKGLAAKDKNFTLTFLTDAADEAKNRFEKTWREIAEGVFFARDLVSEPANILYPETYAEQCKELSRYGLEVKILTEKQMEKNKMHLLLSVGQGSVRESRLVVMRWNGGAKDEAPLALIGKGVCFDTGGISLKPPAGMEDMKWDMAGSAAVVGAMRAIAGAKIKRNVVGLIGLVENMPDGKATRPGDVVTSMSGQTVEVINTDAEGRLVLADVITYAQKFFAPKAMVDVATLTGAIIVSLGKSQSGLFCNNDGLAEALLRSAQLTGEASWRMPLGKDYDELLKSRIADMKNIGGRWAGSVTAACFLERFVDETPWAHLDIAGVAWSDKASATTPAGGTGYGVRLLTHFVEHFNDEAAGR